MEVQSAKYIGRFGELAGHPVNKHIFFQQDGATPQKVSMNIVRNFFPNHVITSKNGDIQWLARSPDLSVCDFFLRGYLKITRFSTTNPTSLWRIHNRPIHCRTLYQVSLQHRKPPTRLHCITYLLMYGAEPFLRSCQLCSHPGNYQQF
jgi:hypothetical protein